MFLAAKLCNYAGWISLRIVFHRNPQSMENILCCSLFHGYRIAAGFAKTAAAQLPCAVHNNLSTTMPGFTLKQHEISILFQFHVKYIMSNWRLVKALQLNLNSISLLIDDCENILFDLIIIICHCLGLGQ